MPIVKAKSIVTKHDGNLQFKIPSSSDNGFELIIIQERSFNIYDVQSQCIHVCMMKETMNFGFVYISLLHVHVHIWKRFACALQPIRNMLEIKVNDKIIR